MTYHGDSNQGNAESSILVVDHSGPYSDKGKHTINDNQSDVNKLIIVHIPDIIFISEDISEKIGDCYEK